MPNALLKYGITAVVGAAGVALLSTQIAGTAVATPALSLPSTYQAEKINQHIVIGPQSAPTVLTRTAALPAGTYLITSIVGAVISSHDQIICAVSNVPNGNDGVFGTAGNPGTGGIYGTATMTDTITVTAGQVISVSCNSFNYGLGTYAATVVVEAVPVASVVKTS